METVFILVAAVGGIITVLGLLLNVLVLRHPVPQWYVNAVKLTPQTIDQLNGKSDWVCLTGQAAGEREGFFHRNIAWARLTVFGNTSTQPVLTNRENPALLTVGTGDDAIQVRVGVLERASRRQEQQAKNPIGRGVPGELNATVTVVEDAILPGDHVCVVGRLAQEHGKSIIRAHYDEACVWRGSPRSFQQRIEGYTHWSRTIAPMCIYYGGFATVLGLLVWSIIHKAG